MLPAHLTRRQGLKLAGAALLGLSAPVRAQDSKILRIIAPFPAGGNADIFARLIGQRLETKLNQTVIIESKPGAGTLIGTEYVVRTPPDGSTLLLTSASLLTLPLAKKDLKFDVIKDLTPVSLPVTLPLTLLTTPSAPFQTLEEMIAWAKARPGQLNVGLSGIGSVSHLAWEQFRLKAGFTATIIPYAGGAPIVQALLSNVVPLAVDGMVTSAGLVKQGQLKILASLTAQRLKTQPNIPSVAEQAAPGYDIENWQGFLMPAGTPKATITTLQDAINEAVKIPEVAARCEQLGMEVVAADADGFARIMAKQLVSLADVAEKANLKFE